MYCPKCGKQVGDDMAFCPSCGSKIKLSYPAPEKQVESPKKQPEFSEKQAEPPKKQPEFSKKQTKPPKQKAPKKRKGKGKSMLIAIIAFLFLTIVTTVAAGIVTYKIKMKKTEDPVRQEQLEAKHEEKSDEKESADDKKEKNEESADKKSEKKESADLEAEEKKEEDGPIRIGGEPPKKTVKKDSSKKKTQKSSEQKKPEKKPEKAPEAQPQDPAAQKPAGNEQPVNAESAQTPVQQQPVQQPVSSPYILPQSNQVYLSEADVAGLDIKLVNYAKNEIFARHGRKFASPELQNYFNSQSWYSGTIDPNTFDQNQESILSSMEYSNAVFLATVEHNIDPNGYALDK